MYFLWFTCFQPGMFLPGMFQLVEIMWQQICTIIMLPVLVVTTVCLRKNVTNENLNGISKLNIIVVFCYVYVYTSIAVNLKNINASQKYCLQI